MYVKLLSLLRPNYKLKKCNQLFSTGAIENTAPF